MATGVASALQNTLQELINYWAIQGVLVVAGYFYLAYFKIPAEVDKESEIEAQKQDSVSRRASEELALSVKRVPTNIIRNQGKDVKALALLVTSQESRKIIELEAKIDFRHSYHEPGFTVFSHNYDLNSFLFWDDEKAFKKKIELRPNIQKILVICEFLRYKTSDDEIINNAILTSDPHPESINFSKESIFQIRIMFQGKLEGEFEYRTLLYKDLFYTKPEEQRILFLDDAEKTYSDIPQELLQEGKRWVKENQKK